MIKAPEMATNVKNLLQGAIVPPWMQNSLARIGGNGAADERLRLAQDGGLPVKGLLFQVDTNAQQQLVKEFFLT